MIAVLRHVDDVKVGVAFLSYDKDKSCIPLVESGKELANEDQGKDTKNGDEIEKEIDEHQEEQAASRHAELLAILRPVSRLSPHS